MPKPINDLNHIVKLYNFNGPGSRSTVEVPKTVVEYTLHVASLIQSRKRKTKSKKVQ